MSYRNPARIVDTQSGQHFRNMQQSLAKTFTGVINADTARILKEAEEAEKEQSLVIRRIEKDNQAAVDAAVQSNIESGTSIVWNLQPSLKANASAVSLKAGQRTEKDMTVISNMKNLKANMNSSLSNVLSYKPTFESTIAKVKGEEGGLNRWSKTNAAKIKGLSVFFYGRNGRSTGDHDPVTGTVSLKAYWNGDGGEELSTEIRSDGVDIELDTVPETKQARVDMTAKLLKMMKLEKGNSDVFIGSKVTSKVEKGTNITKWSRQPTREAVENALYPDALATVMGMSAAEGVVWNNNRKGMGPKVDGFITSSYTDEEKYVENDKGEMVPRPEIVAIAKALAKNAVDTEGQQLLANIEYAGVGAPKDTKPNQTEINYATRKQNYEDGVAVIDAYEDDLSFNRYSTNDSFNDIKEFAGQASIGLAKAFEPQTAEDDDNKIIGFTVKFLDGKGSAAVKPGMSDKQIRKILKRAMLGGQSFYKEKPIKKNTAAQFNQSQE